MIVTRTPFRITLGGGGTDLPSYYGEHGGVIFAMGMDKYMYIMLNEPIVDDRVRLHYSRSEVVDHVSELRHELAREALRYHGIEKKVEISSLADLPDGTGLGSSSAYLVGLLLALHHLRRRRVPPRALAEEACHIELDVLGKGIGKQDQYMAAYGGFTVLDIDRDGTVHVRSVELPGAAADRFVANTHLYYTGVRRRAESVLRRQDAAMRNGASPDRSRVEDALHRIKDLGHRILAAIEAEDFDAWGRMLHEHWCQKRRLSERVTVDGVDRLYDQVRAEHGVLGGKVVGAGGGGFLMLYCPEDHGRLERFMASRGMPRLRYGIELDGCRVIASPERLRASRGRLAPAGGRAGDG